MKATKMEEVKMQHERSTGRKELNQEKDLTQRIMKFSLSEVWREAELAQGKLQAAVLRHIEMGAQ